MLFFYILITLHIYHLTKHLVKLYFYFNLCFQLNLTITTKYVRDFKKRTFDFGNWWHNLTINNKIGINYQYDICLDFLIFIPGCWSSYQFSTCHQEIERQFVSAWFIRIFSGSPSLLQYILKRSNLMDFNFNLNIFNQTR